MTEQVLTEMAAPRRSPFARIGAAILIAALLVLYAYATVAAIGNWIGMASIAQTLTGGLTAFGTVWLLVGALTPPVIAALALWQGRRRGPGERLLHLVLGLSLVAVVQLNIMHFVPSTSYFT